MLKNYSCIKHASLQETFFIRCFIGCCIKPNQVQCVHYNEQNISATLKHKRRTETVLVPKLKPSLF